jgi:ribosomal protein S18 acetylase RimI-like enzyme
LIESEIKIRNAKSTDYQRIISVMPEWWGGRDLTSLLPDLFLIHFSNTCFMVEKGDELIGFLVGFLSQSHLDEAYIHFVGVHPGFRKVKIGKTLYERFFEICRKNDRFVVRSCTSLVNIDSVNFHTRMGFQVEHGAQKYFFTKRLEK